MKMKKIDFKGKDYVPVNERIKEFYIQHPDWTIQTEIHTLDGARVVMKAVILDDTGKQRSNGHAYEREGSSFINKTSFIENCETSAIGRALGILGIGIDTSLASYEEVANAILQQDEMMTDDQAKWIENLIHTCTLPEPQLKQIESEMSTFSQQRAAKCITFLQQHQKQTLDE
jgi:hypothetical protein